MIEEPDELHRLWDELGEDAHCEMLHQNSNRSVPSILQLVKSEKRRRRRLAFGSVTCVGAAIVAMAVGLEWYVRSSQSRPLPNSENKTLAQVPNTTSRSPIDPSQLGKGKSSTLRLRSRLIVVEEPDESEKEKPAWQVTTVSDEQVLALLPKGAKFVSGPNGKQLVIE